jgi:hypothetical protein
MNNNSNKNNYVTSDLFCDVMNRVVEVLQGIQKSSDLNLKECIKEMTKIHQSLSGDSIAAVGNNIKWDIEIDETSQDKDDATAITTKTSSQTSTSGTKKLQQQQQKPPATNIANISSQQSKIPQRPQTSASHGNNSGRISNGWPPPPPPPPMPSQIFIEDDHIGPSWEFVSKEKVDEVFEDCENYKIFARKISYAIFDLEEQKLKMNERNKKKVSELRKIIKLKYPSERYDFFCLPRFTILKFRIG